MKIFIVLGSGNSGAGAIRDFLMSRKDFQSPFGIQEFRIINDPDGINDLYFNLYINLRGYYHAHHAVQLSHE